jgi:PleD family two-component response regulator
VPDFPVHCLAGFELPVFAYQSPCIIKVHIYVIYSHKDSQLKIILKYLTGKTDLELNFTVNRFENSFSEMERFMEQTVYKSTKIIVVDDDVETLSLISDYLSEKGMNVTVAETGEKAIELIKEHAFDIAILDLYLLDTTGLELLREIKEFHPKIQAIMITGYGTIHDAVECMKMGAADFITKPLHLDHILLTINKLLENERLAEEAEMAEQYRMLSLTDELTGLFNLRHLRPTLRKEVERHIRYDHTLSVAMLDIDNFKKYNDTNGHEAEINCWLLLRRR